MGLKNWLLDISCNKCRDNFIRGIPMFIACCQRVDAYGQQQSMARDRETKEAQRLYNMLLGNALHGPLVYDEVLKLLVPVAMAAQTIGETAHIGLRRIVAAVIEESE